MAGRTNQDRLEKKLEVLEKENNRLNQEIETLKRSEQQAVVDQQLLQTLCDQIPAYIYFKDQTRRFVRASNYFCDLFECRLEDIIGKRDEDLFPEEIWVETVADDLRVIEKGKPLVDKEEGGESIGDGGHWVLTTKLPWRDETGRVIGLFGISKDITARKRAEKNLKESEQKFRNLADQSPNMIFINSGGKVVYVNQKCQELGYGTDEFYAPDFNFLKLIAPEYIPLIKKNLGQHMAGNEVDPYEYVLLSKSGERIEVIITTKLIEFEGERAILGIVTDISERKRAELALLEKDDELEQQAKNLEEMNIALKTLLEHREREKREFKEHLLESMKKLVFPYVEKLQATKLNDDSQLYARIIESNLKDIIAPVAETLPSKYLGLTPSEIQVADLIKQGRTSKEIASMLHVSQKAVSFHRGNIRKKLGLQNQKMNLYAYLQSFPDRTDSQ